MDNQCDSVFETIKDELCKMPTLQYCNPNKPYKLFTHPSKYSYSGILHQEKRQTSHPKTYSIFFRQFWKNTATLEYNTEGNVTQFINP